MLKALQARIAELTWRRRSYFSSEGEVCVRASKEIVKSFGILPAEDAIVDAYRTADQYRKVDDVLGAYAYSVFAMIVAASIGIDIPKMNADYGILDMLRKTIMPSADIGAMESLLHGAVKMTWVAMKVGEMNNVEDFVKTWRYAIIKEFKLIEKIESTMISMVAFYLTVNSVYSENIDVSEILEDHLKMNEQMETIVDLYRDALLRCGERGRSSVESAENDFDGETPPGVTAAVLIGYYQSLVVTGNVPLRVQREVTSKTKKITGTSAIDSLSIPKIIVRGEANLQKTDIMH